MAWFFHASPGFGFAFFSSWCQFSLFGMLIGLRAKRLRTVSPVGRPIAEAATLGGPAGGRALGTPGGVPATAAGHGGEPDGRASGCRQFCHTWSFRGEKNSFAASGSGAFVERWGNFFGGIFTDLCSSAVGQFQAPQRRGWRKVSTLLRSSTAATPCACSTSRRPRPHGRNLRALDACGEDYNRVVC